MGDPGIYRCRQGEVEDPYDVPLVIYKQYLHLLYVVPLLARDTLLKAYSHMTYQQP